MKAGNKNSALEGNTQQSALSLASDRLDVNKNATTPISRRRHSAG